MSKKAIAEAIGTFALVLVGTGAAVLGDGQAGILAVGLAFGLTVVAMAYSVGTISGAHLNPAVSLAMYLNKRLSLSGLITYIIAQLVGAAAGSATLYFFLTQAGRDTTNIGATVLAEGLTIPGGFVIEVVLTFLFVLVIMTATGRNGNPHTAGLIIGLTLTAMILVGGNITGASYNPARSFGPALFAGGAAVSQLWLYTLAPLLGGALAAVVAKHVLDTEDGAPGVEQEKAETIT
ncbi:MIP/aquaporin family protein [Atopococcus tabaci]|uniref:MIP/aquaporin family protein n=1 Tax=Atopococcus tabaci TaxID=269774 RepID=UPI002409D4E1|nr:aquaporin [Atopococcus tabaci]